MEMEAPSDGLLLQVIVRVTEPTDWVNSIATPEKQRTGALRVCLNPTDLNRAVKREHYPLPTLEDLTLMLPGAKYSSVLDATSGYWQINLDERCNVCIIVSPFDNYVGLGLGSKSEPPF